MEKHCESKNGFGKEFNGVASKGKDLEGLLRDSAEMAGNFAYKLCQSKAEAQELVQEASYRAYLGWKRYDATRSFKAWLCTILHNAFVDSCRRPERRLCISLDQPIGEGDEEIPLHQLADGNESALRRLEREEVGHRAKRALEGLRSEFRDVLALRDMEGREYEEIARRLKVPVGTVRSRLHRGRKAFRASWQESVSVA